MSLVRCHRATDEADAGQLSNRGRSVVAFLFARFDLFALETHGEEARLLLVSRQHNHSGDFPARIADRQVSREPSCDRPGAGRVRRHVWSRLGQGEKFLSPQPWAGPRRGDCR